jgi:hypothetical protein
VALAFHKVYVRHKYSGNSKGKKIGTGGFDCITVSLSTAATQNRRRVPFRTEEKKDDWRKKFIFCKRSLFCVQARFCVFSEMESLFS